MRKISYCLIFWLAFFSQAHSSLISALESYSKGVKLVNAGKYNEAIKILREVVEENPKLSYSNVLIGICYYNQSDYSSASNEIKKFVSDTSNASDGSDKFPLALVYYLRCQNKLGNFDEIRKYYSLIEKYPIPNLTGIVFSASTLVDTANIKDCPPDLRENVSDLAIKILEKNRNEGKNIPWFNNEYGLALIVKQSFSKDLENQISSLLEAKVYFENEIAINNKSIVFVSESIVERLLAENSMAEIRKKYSTYKKENSFMEHCSEMNEKLKKVFSYYDDSSATLQKAVAADESEKQSKKIAKLENLVITEKNGLVSDWLVLKIKKCSS